MAKVPSKKNNATQQDSFANWPVNLPETNTDSTSVVVAAEPRKRGRPRKIVDAATVVAQPKSPKSEKPIVKKPAAPAPKAEPPVFLAEDADMLHRLGLINKMLLKDQVSSYYQIQKVRIQIGNKLAAHFYRKLGIDATEKLILQYQGDRKVALELMDILRFEFKRIADALSLQEVVKEKQFVQLSDADKGVYSEFTEYSLMQQYRHILTAEKQILSDIGTSLEKFPIWTTFLTGIKGIGPTMGGIIISLIDIHKAATPASIWKYAGLDVVLVDNEGGPDGRGRGRFREHLVEIKYDDTNGVAQTRDSITFNPLLKTKLVGVLADVMIKHRTPIYRDEYDNYKVRVTERENGREIAAKAAGNTDFKRRSPAHLNRMSIRYMMKRLLVDIYIHWRKLEGLPVTDEYGVAKLGLVHHVFTPTKVTRAENIVPSWNESDHTPELF